MKRVIAFVVLLAVAILGIVFAVLNARPVEFNYYFGTLEAPLSLLLVLAVAAGAGLGLLAALGMVVRARHEAARLRQKVALAEKEVANLRAIPIKDRH